MGALPYEMVQRHECVSAIFPDGTSFHNSFDLEKLQAHVQTLSPEDIAVIEEYARSTIRIVIPHAMTALRVAALPLFCAFWQHRQCSAALIVFLLIMLSDVLDGHLARKFRVASIAGAYLDATADFLVVFSIFAIFIVQGLYAYWVALLIIVMFVQFLVTSAKFLPAMYDPVGKYFGGFLFAAIGMTMICPTRAVCVTFSIGVLGMAIISLTSRALTLCSDRSEQSSWGKSPTRRQKG